MILMMIVKYIDIPFFLYPAIRDIFRVGKNIYVTKTQANRCQKHHLKENVAKSTIYDIRVLQR